MKTTLATTLLAVLLLNAGALASDNRAYLKSATVAANITVLTKNQPWPVRSQMTVEPCSLATCAGV